MTMINREIPEFKAHAYKGGEFVEVSKESMTGRWSIMFFYPADFTFVCPTELSDLADWHEELLSLGVDVYSVSTDTHFVHKAWHDVSEAIGNIKYAMVGDPSGDLTRSMGVMREGQGLAERATFLFDRDGKVQYYEVSSEGVGRNAEELVRKVKAAKYVSEHPGEVCPAKWREGAGTLTPSLDLVGKI